MFDNLSEKFNRAFKKLANKGVLTEANISQALKEVKLALLEADVNYRVTNSFLKAVKKRALGQEVQGSLSPAQQFIKIVSDELASMMGEHNEKLALKNGELSLVMMVGLQGSGKTTSAAKLAQRLKREGKKVYVVSADVYRPAAMEQLKKLAGDMGVECYDSNPQQKPLQIVKEAKKQAQAKLADVLIIDTAGRLQIDETLMNELVEIREQVATDEVLFVADAMTGQEAVNVAQSFNEQLGLTGFLLTKMDGDARGGAALSIRAITGQPVKFVGVGEKIEDLEPFYPDRIASRILGMGDLVGLIEKAQEHFDAAKAAEMQQKMRKNQFSLTDFQDQLRQIQKMGSLTDLMGMIPGMGSKLPKNAEVDDKKLKRLDAIISSMTLAEKENPSLMNGSRKIRVSKGSGTEVNEINRLLKQFSQMQKMMKKFSQMGGKKEAVRAMKSMMGGGASPF